MDRQRKGYEVMHLRGVTHLVSDRTGPDLEAPKPPLGIQSEKEGERWKLKSEGEGSKERRTEWGREKRRS